MTVPSCMSLPNSVKADHALGLTADQLIGQPDPKVGSSEQGQLALVGSLKIQVRNEGKFKQFQTGKRKKIIFD